jgi:predicted restriction endonuclease
MRNKDYVLPGFDALAKPEPIRIQSKRTPVGAVAAMAASAAKSGEFDPRDVEDARRKTLAAIVRRQGQPAFRKALLAAYGCRCVVTKCDLEEALEAAHISPYLGEHTNVVSNGLLLRADIHTLFDLGLISIDPETRTVLMTPALRSSEYGAWEGKKILSPSLRNQEPSKLALAKHRRYSGL